MKYQIALVALIAFSIQIASGQISRPIMKKSFLLGGSVIFNYNKQTATDPSSQSMFGVDEESFTFGTDVYCGYFVSNHFSFGLLTDFSIKSTKYSSIYNDEVHNEISNYASFGPFLRYYTKPGLFFEGTFGIGFQQIGSKDNFSSKRYYSISAGVGYAIFITNSVAIEPQIKYRFSKDYWSNGMFGKAYNNEFYASFGLQFYLSSNNLP